jgi:nicotinamidase-related amidase
MAIKIISVDLQKEFSSFGGKHYRPHSNVGFIRDTLVPYLRQNDLKIAEIISDYRKPRLGHKDDSCRPGERGYESELPSDIKLTPVWVKCMNSPIWTRKNIGNPYKKPGLPYQDPKSFGNWLHKVIGMPKILDKIVLVGLTLDCCVLCTAQELNFRGYAVNILAEGVDVYSGNAKEKKMILNSHPLLYWAKPISWHALKGMLKTTISD